MSTDDLNKLCITVYMNNSPCSHSNYNCTQKLITFLEENKRVHLRLYVTNLYNIRRKSCEQESHYNSVKEGIHTKNYNGLKKLMLYDNRCEVNAFTKDIWIELLDTVKVSKVVKDRLLDRYGNRTRSREEEDSLIADDLNHIKQNELKK